VFFEILGVFIFAAQGFILSSCRNKLWVFLVRILELLFRNFEPLLVKDYSALSQSIAKNSNISVWVAVKFSTVFKYKS